ENRRPLLRLRLLLHFDLGDEHTRRYRRHRHEPRFGAAQSIEHLDMIVRRREPAEDREWRADEIHASDQFFPSVRKYPVDHDGQHVEGIREAASRDREAALDVVEEETERLVVTGDLLDEHLLELRP